MKATKITLIAALAVSGLLALSPALRADDATNTPPAGPPGPGMRGRGPSFDMIAEKLNLTDDQKPKVKAILGDQRQQMRDLWQDQDLSREDRMAKMRAIREDTDTKLKAVLTDEQFQKFQEMRPMRGGPRNGPPDGPPPGAPPPDAPPPGGSPPDGGGTNAPAAPPPQA